MKVKSLVADRVHKWLFDDAFPFWAHHGIDRGNGGYFERLDISANPQDPGFKRVRVIGRQIYAFSQAELLGFEGGGELAKVGCDFLVSNAWLGKDGGWARTLKSDGSHLDLTADLYDNAFALFALGWYYRLSNEKVVLDYALDTLTFLERHMRHAKGGFWHEKPANGWRQQNPHMHLLEAALACFESSGHQRFADLANELIDLFRESIFDWSTGTLPEYFEEDFEKADGPEGRITEPGHQFEWVWILQKAKMLLGADIEEIAKALISSANRHGVCLATGATFNQVRDDGVLLDGGSRTWPNTERIKAEIAAADLWGTNPDPAIEAATSLLFSKHLNVQPRGVWMDSFNADGAPTTEFIPASTLYHVVLAFAEVLRHYNHSSSSCLPGSASI